MNFKLILEKIGKELTFENLDNGMIKFQKYLDSFNNGLDEFLKAFASDIKESDERSKNREIIDRKNLQKIFGSSKSTVKLWPDRKTKLI